MKKIIAIIQARTGSTRLPGKVLLTLEGKTVLERVIERAKRSRLINGVVVATTMRKEDLKIVELCCKQQIMVYCGSENDVLDRYYQAARILNAEDIVRITADCPVIDPKIIDMVIRLHLVQESDYTANIIKRTWPDGEDIEIFNFKTLEKAWKYARIPAEREHVTLYMRNHPRLFRLENLSCDTNLSGKRWTLDTKKDYRLIKIIYKKLCKKNRFFGMAEILQLFKQDSEFKDG